MLQLDLKSLRLFVAVCETQSITAAAEREHLEPSAVSKRISQLEAIAGLPLLDRLRRGIQPTTAGRLVLEQARSVLMGVERIEHDLAELKAEGSVRLRLLAPTSAMVRGMFEDIEQFLREPINAQVQISIEELATTDVLREVRGDSTAVGICWNVGDITGIDVHPYRSERLMVITPADHPLSQHGSVALADALAFQFVGLPPGTVVHSLMHAAATASRSAVNYRLNVSNFDVVCHAVAAGMGIGVVPSQVLRQHLPTAEIRSVELTDEWATRTFVVCSMGYDALSREGQRLIDHLVRQK